MKVSAFAIASLVSLGGCDALVESTFGRPRTVTALSSLAPPPAQPGNTSEDEISNGRILEGGKVIDFESMRGPSSAEQALYSAKIEILNSGKPYVSTDSTILGINDDVIAEVGHELATFATPEEVQNCAAYLRSQSAESFFQKKNKASHTGPSSYSTEDIATMDTTLRKAYSESGEVTSAFAKTFYMGTQLLPEAAREAIWAIYVWCRRTDEIVDAPRDSDEDMLKDLGSWEMRLENLWQSGDVEDVFDLCLLDVLVKYPNLPITPFMDMIRGMLMDVPGLGQDRYETFDELHLYCYRVAGTVGLMSLPVFGCAEGFNDEIAK
jgi:phytoene synthase